MTEKTVGNNLNQNLPAMWLWTSMIEIRHLVNSLMAGYLHIYVYALGTTRCQTLPASSTATSGPYMWNVQKTDWKVVYMMGHTLNQKLSLYSLNHCFWRLQESLLFCWDHISLLVKIATIWVKTRASSKMGLCESIFILKSLYILWYGRFISHLLLRFHFCQ